MPLPAKPFSGAGGFRSRDEPGTSQRVFSIPTEVETFESTRVGKSRATLSSPPSERPQQETLNTPPDRAESTTKQNAVASKATLRQAPPPAPPPSTGLLRVHSLKSRTSGEDHGKNLLEAQETERWDVASRSVPTGTTPINNVEEAVIASSVVSRNSQKAEEARSLGTETGGVSPHEAGISRNTESTRNCGESESVASRGENNTERELTGRFHENQEWPSFSRAKDPADPSLTVSPEEGSSSGVKDAVSRSAEEASRGTGELLAPEDGNTTARAASMLTVNNTAMEQTVRAPAVEKKSGVEKRLAKVAESASRHTSVMADASSPVHDMGILGTGRLSKEAHKDNLDRSLSSARNMVMTGATGSGFSAGARSEQRGVLDVPLSRNGLQDMSVDPPTDPAAESGSVGENGRTGERGDVGFGIQPLDFAPADTARGGLDLGGNKRFGTDDGQDQTVSQLAPASLDQGWVEAASTEGGAARDGAQRARGNQALPNTSVPDILSNVSHLDANALENQSPARNPFTADPAGLPVVSRSDISSSEPFGLSFTEQLLSTDEVPEAPTNEQVSRLAVGSTLEAGDGLAPSHFYAPRPNGENQIEAVEMSRTGSTGRGAVTTLIGVGPHIQRLDAVNHTRATASGGAVPPWEESNLNTPASVANITRRSPQATVIGGLESAQPLSADETGTSGTSLRSGSCQRLSRPTGAMMTAAAGHLAMTSSETALATDALGPHASLPGGAAGTDSTALARGARSLGSRPGLPKPGHSTVVQTDAAGAVDFSLFSSNGRVTTGSSEEGGRVRDNLHHPGQIRRPGGVLPTPLGADTPAEIGGSLNNRGNRSVPPERASTVPRVLQRDPSVPTMSRRNNGNISGHRDPSPPSLAYAAQPGDPLRPLSHFGRPTFGNRVGDSGPVSIFLDPGDRLMGG